MSGPRLAAAVAAVAGVATAVCFFVNARQALFSYLVAFNFVVTIALGALGFLLITNAMKACWPIVVRRLGEAIAWPLVFALVFFIPVALGIGRLYPWAKHSELGWLTAPFFVARAALYLALWAAVVIATRHGRQRPSAAALPVVGFSASFAAIDWLMSLDPTWRSTMFGFYYLAGALVGGLAAITLALALADGAGATPGVQRDHYYALGRLQLAFVAVWGYLAYFQFFLIWIGDKPAEASWYVVRLRGGWATMSAALALAHFVVPFFALLPYRIKRSRRALAAISAWLLAAHYLDLHWLAMPALDARGVHAHWCDLAAVVTLGAAAVALISRRLDQRPLLPTEEPALAEALRYRSI